MMLKTILHAMYAYVYGRWPKNYVGLLRNHIIPHLSARGKKRLVGYHGKMLTHEHA
jgi:hypothetical protein